MLSKCHVSASLPYPQTQSAPLYFYSFPHIPLFIGPTTRFIERLVHHNNMLDDIGFFFFAIVVVFLLRFVVVRLTPPTLSQRHHHVAAHADPPLSLASQQLRQPFEPHVVSQIGRAHV